MTGAHAKPAPAASASPPKPSASHAPPAATRAGHFHPIPCNSPFPFRWAESSPRPERSLLAEAHAVDLLPLLIRHRSGDWGDVCADDARANREALDTGLRILSAYDTAAGRLWIITEADRSATTVLLPSEY